MHLRRWLPSRNESVLVSTRVIRRLGDSVSLWLARAQEEPGRWRVGWLCVLAAIVLMVSVVSIPAGAASPSSGTVSQTNPNHPWNGALFVMSTPVPEACPPAGDPGNVRCDHFFLTIDVPATFWTQNTGGVAIRIAWLSSDNDFDLYVYNSDGTQVASSAAGGTTSEAVFLEFPAPGVYEVRVVPFLVLGSDYQGSAILTFTPGAPVPNPTHPTGGIAFGPSTVADPVRTEGEPMIHVDHTGNIWESGPWGTSTQMSFVHRSTDGGDSFHPTSSAMRPDAPPGGGDTDIVTDDQGFAYFVDLEGLANLGAAVSNDGGNTWKKNPIAADPAQDRQWYAVDNGATSAASDNTIFLTVHELAAGMEVYSSPGSMGSADLTGGLVFTRASDHLAIGPGATCGQTKFDPVRRNLYLPCVGGDHVDVITGHVDAMQQTGISFVHHGAPASPGGAVGDLFTSAAVDQAGNVFVAWVDTHDHNVYVSGSSDGALTWTAPLQVNGDPSNTNVWPWIVGGANGIVDVVWYGTSVRGDPGTFPSWFADRVAATTVPWHVYLAQVRLNFEAPASSTIYQARATEHPMNFGQICQEGIGCTTSNGDRSMADFFSVTVDASGAALIVYDDTTNQHHGAGLFVSRQVAGPSVFDTTISRPVPTNPVSDPTGDAQVPHYAPVSGPGLNVPSMDFTATQLSQPSAGILRVRMRVASIASLVPPTGADGIVWLTRWQARSIGDSGETSYRIFYVGARSVGGANPTFFSGTGTSASPKGVPGNGCITNTPQNCKLVEYPAEHTETGSLNRATGNFVIDVPRAHVGLPKSGDTLYSVTAISFAEVSGGPLLQDIDATPAFDMILTKGSGGGGHHGTGHGSEKDPSGADAEFSIFANDDQIGKVSFVDPSMGIAFESAYLTSAIFDGSTATIEGTGFVAGVFAEFRIVMQDVANPGVGKDTFAIELSTGLRVSGTITDGEIEVV
ncbi:MAG: hypothetical protein E6K12_09865 [Methanobacteriota archaeon]|nr:MAG: hypothetical protein E6K12_09865 [Euryarchaeota archaeon]